MVLSLRFRPGTRDHLLPRRTQESRPVWSGQCSVAGSLPSAGSQFGGATTPGSDYFTIHGTVMKLLE